MRAVPDFSAVVHSVRAPPPLARATPSSRCGAAGGVTCAGPSEILTALPLKRPRPSAGTEHKRGPTDRARGRRRRRRRGRRYGAVGHRIERRRTAEHPEFSPRRACRERRTSRRAGLELPRSKGLPRGQNGEPAGRSSVSRPRQTGSPERSRAEGAAATVAGRRIGLGARAVLSRRRCRPAAIVFASTGAEPRGGSRRRVRPANAVAADRHPTGCADRVATIRWWPVRGAARQYHGLTGSPSSSNPVVVKDFSDGLHLDRDGVDCDRFGVAASMDNPGPSD